jgi:hypothetical protein
MVAENLRCGALKMRARFSLVLACNFSHDLSVDAGVNLTKEEL